MKKRRIRKKEILNRNIPFLFFEVIDEKGIHLGKLKKEDALKLSEEKKLDLYCVSMNPSNPVCKILDYGKFKYNKSKTEKRNKKNVKSNEMKEIRITASIDVNDVKIKTEKAKTFLLENKKVKISMRLRGRERYVKNYGLDKLKLFVDGLSEVSETLTSPKLINRIYNIILIPLVKKKKKYNENENKKIIDKKNKENKEQ